VALLARREESADLKEGVVFFNHLCYHNTKYEKTLGFLLIFILS